MPTDLRNSRPSSTLTGLLLGSAAVGAVIWFMIKHSTVSSAMDIAASTAVIAMISGLVGLMTSRHVGFAVFAAGITVLTNDIFLAANFASVLGFGHLALADSIGLAAASSLLPMLISCVYLVALLQRNRRWVLIAFIAALVASFPAKLSPQFFV